MSRPLRLEFEGVFYHITARINLRDGICFGDKDKNYLKAELKQALAMQ